MSTAAPREGRDHDTLLPTAGAFAAIVALAALAAELPAQHAAAQGGVPCTAIEDNDERLACYDRALRAASPASQPPAAPAVQTPAAPAARPPPAQSAPASVSTPATSPAPAAAATPDSGRDADEEIVPIVIVGVRALPGRETTFTARDGATWVQTDSQRVVGLPDTPFDAELKPGAMGSQFLVPKGGGRAIRVRPGER